MITQQEADAINSAAVLLRQQSSANPPTIELGDGTVTGYISRSSTGEAVITVNISTEGVDSSSVLASPNGVRFECRINYILVAGGVANLDTGLPAVARITTAAL